MARLSTTILANLHYELELAIAKGNKQREHVLRQEIKKITALIEEADRNDGAVK